MLARIHKRLLISIAIVALSGCALQYGKEQGPTVGVKFESESQLTYYLLTLDDNEMLGGKLSQLNKKNAAVKKYFTKWPLRTGAGVEYVRRGHYVILIDCGDHYVREKVLLKKGTVRNITCPDLRDI